MLVILLLLTVFHLSDAGISPTWSMCDCHWAQWNVWSQCSAPCGGGKRFRSREVWHRNIPECMGFDKCASSDMGIHVTACNTICYKGSFSAGHCSCQIGWNGKCCNSQIDCGDPGGISHGSVKGSSYTYNSEIVYHCDNYYNLTGGTNTRRCQANATWSGVQPRCAFVNSCESNPCMNQGICINDLDDYNCVCTKGFKGSNCQTVVEYCQSSPCSNQGICINEPTDYRCVCNKGFRGRNCEIEIDCGDPEGISHGSVKGSSYTYNSEIVYHCDKYYNLTGGTNTRRCQANATWSGVQPRCAFVNLCQSSPCMNEGVCVNDLDDYSCVCRKGFDGTNCQIGVEMESPTRKRCRLDCEGGHTHADQQTKHQSESERPTPSRPNCQLGRELDDRIFTYVSQLLPFSPARFGILQLGPLCNASESCSFHEAFCHVKNVANDRLSLPLIVEFNQLFTKGIKLLSDVKENARDLDEQELTAIKILDDYFKEKDHHEQSLIKVLRGNGSDRERTGNSATDRTVVLAEHLLGKLSPESSYLIDSKTKGEDKCPCGFVHCNGHPVYGSTGIGHEEAWHGFVDIILHSEATEISETAASFVNYSLNPVTPTFHDNDSVDEVEDYEGWRTIPELSNAENQAIAQTIVFSFVQRKRHPNSSSFLVPTILISPQDFRVIMYDAVNDILLCSAPLSIFQPYPSNSLQTASILILWMVLHHRLFCAGLDISLITESIGEMKKIQANFKNSAKEKLDLYVNRGRFCVHDFPSTPKESLPTHESLGWGIHLIPQNKIS